MALVAPPVLLSFIGVERLAQIYRRNT